MYLMLGGGEFVTATAHSPFNVALPETQHWPPQPCAAENFDHTSSLSAAQPGRTITTRVSMQEK